MANEKWGSDGNMTPRPGHAQYNVKGTHVTDQILIRIQIRPIIRPGSIRSAGWQQNVQNTPLSSTRPSTHSPCSPLRRLRLPSHQLLSLTIETLGLEVISCMIPPPARRGPLPAASLTTFAPSASPSTLSTAGTGSYLLPFLVLKIFYALD